MATGFLALLATGAGLLWLVESSRSFTAAVGATQEVRFASLRVLSLLQDAETSQRGYLLTAQDSYLGPYRAAAAELPAALPDLTARIIADGGIPDPPRALERLAAEKLAELAETIATFEAGDRTRALALVDSGHGRAVMDQIRFAIDGIEVRSAARLAARSESLRQAERTLLLGAGFALLLIFAVSLGALLLSRRYLRDMEAAQAVVETVNARLEARVAERTAALASANDEIQRFAYIVSHDLRAPLVNVMGFTAELETAVGVLGGLLAEAETKAPELVTPEARAAIAEELPEAIGFIRSSTERMDRLINAILRLSREGRRALKPEPVALGPLVEGIAASLHHQVEAAGASISVQPGLPTLRTDRLAVEQILGNLIDNAIKYLDAARPGRISIEGRRAATRILIEVVDNGRGIDPRDHDRVFELFRRSGRQDQKGEGIGLAHVRALARRLGGEVTLTSVPGTGSRFRLTLPQDLPPDLPPPAPEEPTA